VNRTMRKTDFLEPTFRAAADAVQETQRMLNARGLEYTHWCGQLGDAHLETTKLNKGPKYEPLEWAYDDARIPWYTLWEYSSVLVATDLLNLELKPKRVLSLGGSASSMEATIARFGHHVEVIDRRRNMLEHAKANAKQMGWDMTFQHADLKDIDRVLQAGNAVPFDVVVSVSVLFLAGGDAREAVREDLQHHVRPGGIAAITFDFVNPNPERYIDDPEAQLSFQGFQRVGAPFYDRGDRHHLYYPDESKGHYTAGCLVQQRQTAQ